MEIHSPDIYGPVGAAGNPGIAGQVLTSNGPAAQVTWGPPAANFYEFTSASALSHNIAHNLGNAHPVITIYVQGTVQQIEPATVDALDANNIQVTFFAARAIEGTVVG